MLTKSRSGLYKFFSYTLIVSAILFVIVYFQTTRVFEAASYLTLRLSGVDKRFVGEFYTFEKNNCSDTEKCVCALLIHGLGDTAFTWSKTLREPSENYDYPMHFFATNLPGSLESPILESRVDYGPHSLAQKLSDSYLPLCKKWILMGNSYGAWLSVHIANQHPDRVIGMILTGPAGLNKDYSHILDFFLKPSIKAARDFYNKAYFNVEPVPDFIFRRMIERSSSLPIKEMLFSVKEKDFLDTELESNTVPTKIIWGAADRVMLSEWAEEYHQRMKNSQLTIFPECGHLPQKECFDSFKQELNKSLTDFLVF